MVERVQVDDCTEQRLQGPELISPRGVSAKQHAPRPPETPEIAEPLLYLVPGTGIEPVWYFYRGILSPLRLPISPPGLFKAGHCTALPSGFHLLLQLQVDLENLTE